MFRFALLFAGSAALLKGFGFLLSLWIARALVPDEYGIWGLAFAIQVGISTFGMVGIQESLVGLLHRNKNDQDTQDLYAAAMGAFVRTISLTLIGSLLVIFFVLRSKSIGYVGYASILISGAVMAFAAIQGQIARLEEDHSTSLIFSFLIPFVGLIGSAALFYIFNSPESFFIGSGLGVMSATVIFRHKLFGFLSPYSQVGATRELLLRRVTPFIFVAFFGWLSGYGGSFFVDKLFDLEDVAKLTFLLTVGSVLQLLTSALNQVWSPRFYSLIHSKGNLEAVETLNHRFYSAQGWGLGVIAAICIAGIPRLLDFVGGQLTSYRHMQTEMLLIFSGYIILVPWTHCQNYLLVYDKGKRLLYVVLSTSIAGIAFWFISMISLGAIGIYVGFFIQMILRTIGISVATREWPIRLSWGGAIGGILIASAGLLFPAA